jgi:hypothetical protein
MTSPPDKASRPAADRHDIRSELLAAQAEFHALLDAVSDRGWWARSTNPGWTNGEILFHIVLGFALVPILAVLIRLASRLPPGATTPFAAVLNLATPFFNRVNGIGPRIGARLFRRRSLGRLYDWVVTRNLRLVDRLDSNDWQRGMYYPTKWDSLFSEYMTMARLLRYPITHLRFHRDQLAQQVRALR